MSVMYKVGRSFVLLRNYSLVWNKEIVGDIRVRKNVFLMEIVIIELIRRSLEFENDLRR